jgi:hypothetical protein
LRGQLQLRENELAHVRSAKRQIGDLGQNEKVRLGGLTPPTTVRKSSDAAPPSEQTIKDLILKALWFGFREQGATSLQLREFISDVYRRGVDRTSLSPQLSRLKSDGQIRQKILRASESEPASLKIK